MQSLVKRFAIITALLCAVSCGGGVPVGATAVPLLRSDVIAQWEAARIDLATNPIPMNPVTRPDGVACCDYHAPIPEALEVEISDFSITVYDVPDLPDGGFKCPAATAVPRVVGCTVFHDSGHDEIFAAHSAIGSVLVWEFENEILHRRFGLDVSAR